MHRKVNTKHYKMADQDEPRDVRKSCLSAPKSYVRTLMKNVLNVVDVYLLFFGMVIVMIIGFHWTMSGLFLAKLQAHYVCVVLIFIVFGLQLNTDAIFMGLKSYKAIIWCFLAVLFVTPALGIQITKTIHFATLSDENITTEHSLIQANVSAIGPTEFALGLEVFYAVPSSFSFGAVLAMIAGGNLALSLLVMLVTNIVGVFSVPQLLIWLTSINSNDVDFKGFALIMGIFLLTVILPTMVGRVLRVIPRVEDCIDTHPRSLRYVVIALLVLSTWPMVSKAQAEDKYGGIVAMNTMAIMGFTTIMHVIFLLLNWIVCGILKLELSIKKTVVVLGSHKAVCFALTVVGFLPDSADSRDLMGLACIIAYLVILAMDSLVVSKLATLEEDPLGHLFTEEEKYRELPTGE